MRIMRSNRMLRTAHLGPVLALVLALTGCGESESQDDSSASNGSTTVVDGNNPAGDGDSRAEGENNGGTSTSTSTKAEIIPPPQSVKQSPAPDDLLYPASLGDRIESGLFTPKGYIDSNGEIAFDAVFQEAHPFHDGLARVKDNETNKFGYINKTGAYVIEPRFVEAQRFSNGLAAVKLEDHKEIETDEGTYLFPAKWGFINKQGELVIEAIYYDAKHFSNGLAPVLLEPEMLHTLPPKATGLDKTISTPGLAPAGKWGYINKQGNVAIKAKYDDAYSFSNGLAEVMIANATWRYGYINTNGESVIDPKFAEAGPFGNGLAPVAIKGQGYVYINRMGEVVINPATDEPAQPFSEGLAGVSRGNQEWVYIDTEGNTAVIPKLSEKFGTTEIGLFRNGVASLGGRYYINRQGEVIWPPEE